jgi:hypothetical protein
MSRGRALLVEAAQVRFDLGIGPLACRLSHACPARHPCTNPNPNPDPDPERPRPLTGPLLWCTGGRNRRQFSGKRTSGPGSCCTSSHHRRTCTGRASQAGRRRRCICLQSDHGGHPRQQRRRRR